MELADSLDFQELSPQAPSQEDIDEFRRLSAEQAAGVAVVSTVLNGRDYAATVSSYLSVSYDPPTLLVSLYEGSRIAQAVKESGVWSLTILNSQQRKEANWLASPGTPIEGLLAQIDYGRAPASGAAVVLGNLAHFDVKTDQVIEAATHLLFVGTVIAQGSDESRGKSREPLVHYTQEYRQLK